MKTNKTRVMKQIQFVIKIAVVLFAVAIAYVYGFGTHESNNKNWNGFVTADVSFANGKQEHFDSSYMRMLNKGDRAVIHVSLPEDKKLENAMLNFWLYNSVVEAYNGDKLIYSYGQDIEANGDMIGGVYAYVPIPDSAWGEEITIQIDVTEDNAFTKVSSFTMQTGDKCMRNFVWQNLINLFFSISGFIFSLVMFVTIAILPSYKDIRWGGVFLTLFIFLSSVWIFTNSGLYHIISTAYFWVPLEYSALYFMPMPLVLYLLFFEKSKPIRIGMIVLTCITGIFNITCVILNCTNTIHFCRTLTYAHVLLLINILVILFDACKRALSRNKSASYLLIGIGVMMLVSLFDIFRFYIIRLFSVSIDTMPSTVSFGLGLLVIFLVIAFYNDVNEESAKAMYLEEDLKRLRHIVSTIPSALCVFDRDRQSQALRLAAENDALWQLIGQEKNGTDIMQNIPEETLSVITNRIFQQKEDKKQADHFEVILRKPSGEDINLQVLTHIDTTDREMITVNAFDITQQKKLEENLRIGQQNYQLVLDQAGRAFAPLDFISHSLTVTSDLEELYGIPHLIKVPEDIPSLDIFDEANERKISDFFQRVFDGSQNESVRILCHKKGNANLTRWFQFTCSTVFNNMGKPYSAILTFENIHDKYMAEVDGKWKHQSIAALSESKYEIINFNLSTERYLRSDGELMTHIDSNADYKETHSQIESIYIATEEREKYLVFVDKNRLIDRFKSGVFEDAIDIHIIGKNGAPMWVNISVQTISEPYTNNILAQFIYKNIQDQKNVSAKLEQDIQQLKTELESSRIKILVNQMQPHFLYNALSAIRAITKVNPDYAYDMLYDFTVHLRASIRALSSDDLIPFSSELENIKAYLNIEKMRFGDRLDIEYDIKTAQFLIVPLSIQPIAENAVRHGIYPKGSAGGKVRITTYETGSAYVVTVSDDGVGFDVQKTLQRDSDSIGLKNMLFRIQTLVKGTVLINSTHKVGTVVTVSIPKKTEELQP